MAVSCALSLAKIVSCSSTLPAAYSLLSARLHLLLGSAQSSVGGTDCQILALLVVWVAFVAACAKRFAAVS